MRKSLWGKTWSTEVPSKSPGRGFESQLHLNRGSVNRDSLVSIFLKGEGWILARNTLPHLTSIVGV